MSNPIEAVHKDGSLEHVEVDGAPAPNSALRIEQDRIEALIKATVHAIKQDSPAMWTELLEKQASAADDATRRFKDGEDVEGTNFMILSDPSGKLATALWRKWNDEHRADLIGLELVQGYCVNELHSWLRVIGDAEIMCDARHFIVLDPKPRGVGMVVNDIIGVPFAFIVWPNSPHQQAYAGKRVGVIEATVPA